MKVTSTEPTSIQAVVFDLGRVLVDFDWQRALGEVSERTGLSTSEIKRRLVPDQAFTGFEVGRLSAHEFHAQFEQILELKMPFDHFTIRWNSIFTREIAEVVGLAQRLRDRPGVRVAILSNTNVLHAEYLRGRFGWLREWDHVYMSHEIGARKPDARAYEIVLERIGVGADRTAFVDDLPQNIEAARALGMRGVLAASPAAVLDGLAALGVKA
jgi:putative hydrolase of the HAD superfamily